MSRIAALALAVALVSPALAQAQVPKVRPYTSAKWGFTAQFPWEPKEQPQGAGITVAAGNVEDTIAYMISATPIDAEVLKQKTIPRILDDAVKGAVDNVHGTVLEQRDVRIAGYPGREVVISGEGFKAHCRVYIVKDRMYLPMVIYKPELKLPMAADAFHAAFQLIASKK